MKSDFLSDKFWEQSIEELKLRTDDTKFALTG